MTLFGNIDYIVLFPCRAAIEHLKIGKGIVSDVDTLDFKPRYVIAFAMCVARVYLQGESIFESTANIIVYKLCTIVSNQQYDS